MLIQTVAFGWVFEDLLGGKGTHAIIFSGALFAIGAVAILFVSPPKETEESPIMPPGAPSFLAWHYYFIRKLAEGGP